MSEEKKKVLMICLGIIDNTVIGNICRSPIAEAVFQNEVNKRGLQDQWEVDSAAIIGFHKGRCPDDRALSTLKANGITDYSHRARQMKQADFNKYDWIFGMDHENMFFLTKNRPENCRAKVELLGNYDPSGNDIIRDPYYDHDSVGFQKVYVQCLASVTAFLDKYSN